MAEHERVRHAEIFGDLRHVVSELYYVRVLRLQRRRECEARKIDDVHGPAETAQATDLRGERAPVGRKPRDDERMRWSSAAPACHPEAVPVARRDVHLHGHHLCNGRAGRACRWAAAGRALETLRPPQ